MLPPPPPPPGDTQPLPLPRTQQCQQCPPELGERGAPHARQGCCGGPIGEAAPLCQVGRGGPPLAGAGGGVGRHHLPQVLYKAAAAAEPSVPDPGACRRPTGEQPLRSPERCWDPPGTSPMAFTALLLLLVLGTGEGLGPAGPRAGGSRAGTWVSGEAMGQGDGSRVPRAAF